MAHKVNTKCKDCRHCSPPSIIEEPIPAYNSPLFCLSAPKRKIVYRCMLGMNHTSIASEIMLIDDNSHYKCDSFSRK